jgi:hypothetical protein
MKYRRAHGTCTASVGTRPAYNICTASTAGKRCVVRIKTIGYSSQANSRWPSERMVSGPAFMACKSNEICTAIQDDISLAAILPACEPTMNMSSQPKTSEELAAGLRACSGYLAAAAAFSVAINLLYLAPPLYMLQISDRVVSSGSIVTPVMLTIALLMAFVALAALDASRH